MPRLPVTVKLLWSWEHSIDRVHSSIQSVRIFPKYHTIWRKIIEFSSILKWCNVSDKYTGTYIVSFYAPFKRANLTIYILHIMVLYVSVSTYVIRNVKLKIHSINRKFALNKFWSILNNFSIFTLGNEQENINIQELILKI